MLDRYMWIAIGILLLLLAGAGFYIRALRSDNELLVQQRDTFKSANESLTKTLATVSQANEAAARVNDELQRRLVEQRADFDVILRNINHEASGAPVDPVVRNTLDRLWGTTSSGQNGTRSAK